MSTKILILLMGLALGFSLAVEKYSVAFIGFFFALTLFNQKLFYGEDENNENV